MLKNHLSTSEENRLERVKAGGREVMGLRCGRLGFRFSLVFLSELQRQGHLLANSGEGAKQRTE